MHDETSRLCSTNPRIKGKPKKHFNKQKGTTRKIKSIKSTFASSELSTFHHFLCLELRMWQFSWLSPFDASLQCYVAVVQRCDVLE